LRFSSAAPSNPRARFFPSHSGPRLSYSALASRLCSGLRRESIMATTSSHPTKVNISKQSTGSSIGAPSQRKQSTRKGKRAWRKNVDLDDVEEALEEARTEERVVG
jgi:hypothetical protein